MKLVTNITITAILGCWVGYPHVANYKVEQLAEAETQAAIELSCGDVDLWMQPDCKSDLTDEFASGSTTPQSIVQLHCTQFKNTWEPGSAPRRPDLCEQYLDGSVSS